MSRREIDKICLFCSKTFETVDKRTKYCSHSCASTATNINFPRTYSSKNPFRKPSGTTKITLEINGKNKRIYPCLDCNGPRAFKAKRCRRCKDLQLLTQSAEKSIQEVKIKQGQSMYVAVRQHAKSCMLLWDIPKYCILCGYTKYLEVAHIKSIALFDKSAKLKEVNSIHNIVFMCPNHHKELDHNLLAPNEFLRLETLIKSQIFRRSKA